MRILIILPIFLFTLFQGKYLFSETKLIRAYSGNCPIILSAPHGGKSKNIILGVPLRKGKGVKLFRYLSDVNTDEIADTTAKILSGKYRLKPYIVIADFSRRQLDVNRERKDAYENESMRLYYESYHSILRGYVKQCREKFGKCILIDIHGQSRNDSAVYRGTRKGKTVAALIKRSGAEAVFGKNSVTGFLEKKKYRVLPKNSFDEKIFQGGYIIKTYGSNNAEGVDAIQIEFGGDYRKKGRVLYSTSADLAEALNIFYKTYLKK